MPSDTSSPRGHCRVPVPLLTGLTVIEAHNTALDAGLLAVDQDRIHTPTYPGVVVAQQPPSGVTISSGQEVKIWAVKRPDPPHDDEDGEDGWDGDDGNQPVPTGPSPLAGSK